MTNHAEDGSLDGPRIRLRSWTPGSADDVRDGLLGWISVEVDRLILDSIAVRRTATGRLALSFPSRTARDGRRHPIVRPLDDEARQSVERELLRQIAQQSNVVPEVSP